MAYAFRRENKGTPSFTGVYEGPDGARRSAGTFPSRRAALRAAQREEQAVRGEVVGSFPRSHHIRGLRSALLIVLRQPVDGQDLAVVGSGVGDEGDCGGAISSVGSQVSRRAALDLERAVRDQLILINPCEHTELPKIIVGRTRTLTPDEFRSPHRCDTRAP
jgi:hypothetical protein